MASFLQRLRELLIRERWTVCLTLAALLVRLHWNLVVHPLEDYLYSDMGGYASRADRILDDPWETYEYAAFFPFGNSWFVAGMKLAFGRENFFAISVTYAVLGALVVMLAYLVARRATAHPWVAPGVGLVLIFYYPLISYGGYILSEVPWMVFLLSAQLFLLRLMEKGRLRDAAMAGVCVAVGMVFRPQLLLSCAFFGLYWIVTRKYMPAVKLKALLVSAIPIVLVLGMTSYRFHRHTGRLGLISENASLNYMFGRCHAARIQSNPDGQGHGRVHFRPPPYLQMRAAEGKKGHDAWLWLNPALGYEIHYRGYIGDKKIHAQYVKKCIEKTGLWGQVKYAFTDIVLLWHYNIPWPDSGKREWRSVTKWWQQRSEEWFAIPAILSLITVFRPSKTLKQGVVALNLLVLLVLAVVFFGGARLRTAYDPLLIFLALETYGYLGWRLYRFVVSRLAARSGPSSPQDSSSS